MIGQTLAHYRITAALGAGGMGEVYRATDTRLHRDVAIKVLPEAVSADASRLARFEREAKAVAALSHPNIMAIYEFGSHEGRAYAVMELLEGESLRARLAQGPLPPSKAVDHAAQIARGLAASHERGIVHRDLKPDNVFVTRDGQVKILDFGLAKVGQTEDVDRTGTPTSMHLTEPGSMMGTVGYTAPEQIRGGDVDHRADIFSFGAMLYELLTGRRPFDRETAAETMTAILREDPPPLDELDPGTARTVLHCLEKRPDDRFQSARDLVFALEAPRSGSRPSLPPAPVVGAAARERRRGGLAVTLLGLGLAAGSAIGWLVGSGAGSAPQRPGTQPVFQRLTFARGTLGAARFAADGTTVIYSARWRDRPSELFSVSEGGTESLPLGIEGAKLLSVSSKGELAILRDARLSSGELLGTLAQVPLGSRAPREVAERVIEADWSARGERISLLREQAYQRIVESPPGTRLLETGKFANLLRASPTGGDLALWIRKQVGNDLGEITLIAPSGETRVVGECRCTGLAWTASGSELWFTEGVSRGETLLAAVDLSGDRREIRRMAGRVTLQDMASDGRLLLAVNDWQSGIFGRTPFSKGERDLSWLDGSVAARLSDDGRTLLFNEVGPGGGPGRSFYLRDLAGDAPAVRLGEGLAVDLSPDGRLVLAYDPDTPGRFKLVPTGAGPTRTIDIGRIDSVWGWFVPGRDEILINGREPGRAWRFYLVSPDGGEPRPVGPEGVDNYRGQQPLSPDGRRIAGVRSLAPGADERIFDLDATDGTSIPGYGDRDVMLRWAAGGEAMIVFDRDTLPAPVYRIDLATGRRTLLHSLMPIDSAGIRSIESLGITPDGSYYAYNYTRRLDVLYRVEGLE